MICLLRRVCNGIAFLSELLAKSAMWLVVVLIAIIAYDVVMRYAFDAPTSWSFTLAYMLGGSISIAGLAYNHLHDVNVRIDIIYVKLRRKHRLIIDLVLTGGLLLPLAYSLTRVFARDALFAFTTNQRAVETPWYPVIWPYKAMLAIGLGLLLLQAIAIILRDIMALTEGDEK